MKLILQAIKALFRKAETRLDALIPAPKSATVGQMLVVKAVDENGKPTEWAAVDMPEQANADWNQNDHTAPGYVENRTHYEDGETVKQLDEKFIPDSIARKEDIPASAEKADLEVKLEHYSDIMYFYAPAYDEIRAAHLQGQRVFMKAKNTDAELVLLSCNDLKAEFLGFNHSQMWRGTIMANNTQCSVWYKTM